MYSTKVRYLQYVGYIRYVSMQVCALESRIVSTESCGYGKIHMIHMDVNLNKNVELNAAMNCCS